MAILNGDLKNPSKKEQKARAAKYSPEANTTVMNLKARSQSGFKGEEKNDHGLPKGGSDVVKPKKGSNTLHSRPRYDTYAEGTDSIVVDKPKRKKKSKGMDSTDIEVAKPMVLNRPDISNLANSSTSMQTELKDVPDPISDAKRADMDKVRAHQTKLNKYGANLEVDGMWGDKTAAASRDLYPKYKAKPSTKSKSSSIPVSKRNMMVNPKQTTVEETPKYRSKAETDKAWMDYVGEDKSNKGIPVGRTDSSYMNVAGAPRTDYSGIREAVKNKIEKGGGIPFGPSSIESFDESVKLDGIRMRDKESKSNSNKPKSVVKAAPKRNDKTSDYDARVIERMYPDPEMHGGGFVNRKQAEKLVDIEQEGEAQTSKYLKAAGASAAVIGGATLLGLAAKKGLRGRAIKAVNKQRQTMRIAAETSADAVVNRGGKPYVKPELSKLGTRTKPVVKSKVKAKTEVIDNSADGVIRRAEKRGELIVSGKDTKSGKSTKTKTKKKGVMQRVAAKMS